VRREIAEFLKRNSNLLDGLDPETLADLIEKVIAGSQREVQESLYMAMNDRERMTFARITAERMDAAVSVRLRLLAFVSDAIQTLTDVALTVIKTWLRSLVPTP
jgi:phosphoserine phosphatase